jgi:hypothetical protein
MCPICEMGLALQVSFTAKKHECTGTCTRNVCSILMRFGLNFVAAYGGTKIILLGGGKQLSDGAINGPVLGKDITLKDVYMLDVATSVWSKLADAPSSYYEPICAVSGDFLVVYGGYSTYADNGHDGKTIVTNGNPPSILNLKDNVWVTEYKPLSTSSSSPLLLHRSMSLGHLGTVFGFIASLVSLL